MPVADYTTICGSPYRSLPGRQTGYGVVEMSIDTDTRYAYTRAIADHLFRSYDGVLKIDGEVGRKKDYDPRTYLSLAETSRAERVKQAARDLGCAWSTIFSFRGEFPS